MMKNGQSLFPEGWSPVTEDAPPHHRKVLSERVTIHVTTRRTGWEQFGVDAPDWHYCVVLDGANVFQLMLDTRTSPDVDGAPHLEAARRAEEVGAALLRDIAEVEGR